MKIEESEFIEGAANGLYAKKDLHAKVAEVKKDPDKYFQQMIDFVEAGINSDTISRAELIFDDDEDMKLRLETSIINLPLDYSTNINKIMTGDGIVDVNVYMIIISPNINKSKLRIDELASSDDFLADKPGDLHKFHDWLTEQFATIAENEKADK